MPSIAVMNAKGGVGKSTLTMALAETLAIYHGKRVLLIDSDGQMSLSLMMMSVDRLNTQRGAGASITGFLQSVLPTAEPVDWRNCVTGDVSDVDDAANIYIVAGDMDLPLLEREFAAQGAIGSLRRACRSLLEEASEYVDLVIVDCAPGISVVTECWLRECDWHLIPAKPDVLAVSGMQYLNAFKKRQPDLGFARHLGVVINMKNLRNETEQNIHEILAASPGWACFRDAIPWISHIQKAALYMPEKRSYQNKYPAEAGLALKGLATDLLDRVGMLR